MRLYTRTGATALDHPVFGHFEASPDGGFDFPNELSDQLHGFAVRGRPLWETDVERQRRLMAEELERRKDPATLLSVVEQIMQAAQSLPVPAAAPVSGPSEVPLPASEPAEAVAPVAKKRPGRRPAAAPVAE